MTHNLCPAPQMLSAYLDGKLDAAERAKIEDHVSRCEDCYFVVKEVALVAAALGDEEGPLSAAPGGALPRPGGWQTLSRLLPLAAALIVGVGALALWRLAGRAEPYAEAMRPLVEAVGERRFFEPRLTGGFKYGPSVTSKRAGGGGISSESWAVLAAAGEMRQRPEPSSTEARASRAAAALFLGDADLAIAEYSRLVVDDAGNAAWSSDLAAALLVRASSAQARETDRAEALRLAEQALRLDPGLAEAGFNRGLALKSLGRNEEARRDFAAIVDQGGPWAAAARDQLRDMGPREGQRP